jgi:hypothetical protein
VLYAPPLQDAFDTVTLGPGDWLAIIGCALVTPVLIEALKISPLRMRR